MTAEGEDAGVGVGERRREHLVGAQQAGRDEEPGHRVPEVGVGQAEERAGHADRDEHVAEGERPQREEELAGVGAAGDVRIRGWRREQPAQAVHHVEDHGVLPRLERLPGPHRHRAHGRREPGEPVLGDDAEHPDEGIGVGQVDGLEHRLAKALLALGGEEQSLDHLPAHGIGCREQPGDDVGTHPADLVPAQGRVDERVADVAAAGADGGREDRAEAG